MKRDKALPSSGNPQLDLLVSQRWCFGTGLWGAMLDWRKYDGEDHDHCVFCFRRLCPVSSSCDDGIHEGFAAFNGSWVCPECYGLMRDALGLRLYDPAVWEGADLYCFLRAAITWKMPPYSIWDIELLMDSLGEKIPNVSHEKCLVVPVMRKRCEGGDWAKKAWSDTHLAPLSETIPLLRLEDVLGLWKLMRPRVGESGYEGELLIDFGGF